MRWCTKIEVVVEELGLVDYLEFYERLTMPEVYASVYIGEDESEDESVQVSQSVIYSCPETGVEFSLFSDEFISLPELYAELDEDGFIWSDKYDAWVFDTQKVY